VADAHPTVRRWMVPAAGAKLLFIVTLLSQRAQPVGVYRLRNVTPPRLLASEPIALVTCNHFGVRAQPSECAPVAVPSGPLGYSASGHLPRD
jgi:hypothetical protein